MAYEDQEQLEQLRRLWDRFGWQVTAGIVLALVVVVGWRWYEARLQARAEAASVAYGEVMAASDYPEAQAAVAVLHDEHKHANYQMLGDLHLAARAVEADDLDGAESALRHALSHAEHDVDRHIGRLRLARVLLAQGEFEAAEALRPPSGVAGPFAADWAELRGDLARAQQRPDEARTAYREALAAAGASTRADLIQLKLDDLGG